MNHGYYIINQYYIIITYNGYYYIINHINHG